jgi:hypothetical protein
MASSTIGSLLVALGLDTAQFEAGANKSKSIARGLSKDIESSFKSAKVAVEGLVAAFAIGALTEQIKQSLQYAAAIGETASTLGVTTKQLQEFRFAAGQVGVSQEALQGGLQRLAISIGKSKLGSEAQTKAFEALAKASHSTVAELRSGNTGEVFGKIADALKNVTDHSQRAAAEVALFGKTGAQLDSLLSGGSARLNALGEAAHQLGVVLSEDQIANAEVTAHKLEALKTVLEANIASTVTANANSILSLAQALSTLTNQIIHFFSANPQLALAIVGGLAGSRLGVAGAVIGAAGGAFLGNRVAENAADQNPDLHFRIKELQKARDEVNARRAAAADSGALISFRHGSGSGGTVDSALAEFKKQKALLDQATAAALAPKGGPVGGVNIDPFLAGKGPKGPKGRKPPADRSDELLAQMDKEILQADQNILQAKLALSGSAEEHLQIAVQLVNLEKTVKEKAIDEELAKAQREKAEGKITAAALAEAEAKGRILKAAAEEEAAIKLRVIVEHELEQHDHDLVALSVQQLQFHQDALRTADQLATTQEDHRRIQLSILDAEIEQQRLQLESNKRDAIRNGAKQEEIDLIQKSIDNLENQRAQGAAVIRNNTKGPLETYISSIPHTAAEINQALQTIEVDGLDSLISKITETEDAFKHLGQTFLQTGEQIALELVKLYIKMLLFRAVSAPSGFAGSIPSPNTSGLAPVNLGIGGPGTLSTGAVTLPGLAGGGSFMVGGRGGTDMNVLSINGVPRARVGNMERVSVGNDNIGAGMPPPVQIVTNIDATGADPAELSRVRGAVEQMNAELPYRVVQAWYDAASRNVIR